MKYGLYPKNCWGETQRADRYGVSEHKSGFRNSGFLRVSHSNKNASSVTVKAEHPDHVIVMWQGQQWSGWGVGVPTTMTHTRLHEAAPAYNRARPKISSSQSQRYPWHKMFRTRAQHTCEQLAMIFLGRPMDGAQATSRTQSLCASSFFSSTHSPSSSLCKTILVYHDKLSFTPEETHKWTRDIYCKHSDIFSQIKLFSLPNLDKVIAASWHESLDGISLRSGRV